MAFIRKDDKTYIKVNMNKCYLNNTGFYVNYSLYKSETERKLEKEFILNYNEFYEKALKYYSELGEDVELQLIELEKIRYIIYNDTEIELEFEEELIQFGFDIKWKDLNITRPSELTIYAGKYIGQPFSIQSMYRLLSKKFSNFVLEMC